MTKARVSADGDINPRIASVSWHSRRHTSLVECLGHLLKGRRNHTGQANCGGFTEILLGRGLAGCFIAGLRHATLMVGEDSVKLLLDVFGHTRYSESTPYSQHTSRRLDSARSLVSSAPMLMDLGTGRSG